MLLIFFQENTDLMKDVMLENEEHAKEISSLKTELEKLHRKLESRTHPQTLELVQRQESRDSTKLESHHSMLGFHKTLVEMHEGEVSFVCDWYYAC